MTNRLTESQAGSRDNLITAEDNFAEFIASTPAKTKDSETLPVEVPPQTESQEQYTEKMETIRYGIVAVIVLGTTAMVVFGTRDRDLNIKFKSLFHNIIMSMSLSAVKAA